MEYYKNVIVDLRFLWYNVFMVKTAINWKLGAKKRGKMGVYSSLVDPKKSAMTGSNKTNSSKDTLRPLPKEQPARFFAHFRWERIKAYWFSMAGLKRIGKIFVACVLIGIIGVGALPEMLTRFTL